eukprot:m.267209 g.267209  ORF g.267209 m.267209 type:complete len:125 (+) comp54712_c0_seq15:1016-1390(+)
MWPWILSPVSLQLPNDTVVQSNTAGALLAELTFFFPLRCQTAQRSANDSRRTTSLLKNVKTEPETGNTRASPEAPRPANKRPSCICGAPVTSLCSGCRKQAYCGPACQLKHWPIHADTCPGAQE